MPFRFNRMSGFVTMMLLLASLLGGRAFADDLYGSIRGNVTDATGAAIVGATVTATNTKTGVTTKVKTDNKGRYDFVQLAVGDYSVEVMQAGFKSLKTDAITLVVNQVYSLDVPLSAGGAQDVVEVKGDAVQVDREDVQLKTLFTDQQIVDLPLISRNFTALEQLAPGVQAVQPVKLSDQRPGLKRPAFEHRLHRAQPGRDLAVQLDHQHAERRVWPQLRCDRQCLDQERNEHYSRQRLRVLSRHVP
jgi:hypothetical protein